MNEKDDNLWGKVEPLISNPQNILHTEEEDEPTHTLLGPLEKIHVRGTCHLCGAESFDGRCTSYHNQLYFVCDNCGKLNGSEIEKRFSEIEKQKSNKK